MHGRARQVAGEGARYPRAERATLTDQEQSGSQDDGRVSGVRGEADAVGEPVHRVELGDRRLVGARRGVDSRWAERLTPHLSVEGAPEADDDLPIETAADVVGADSSGTRSTTA